MIGTSEGVQQLQRRAGLQHLPYLLFGKSWAARALPPVPCS